MGLKYKTVAGVKHLIKTATPHLSNGCTSICYRLVRCDDTSIFIYSVEDLSAYLHHQVKINGDAVHVWYVELHSPTSDCSSPTTVLPLTDSTFTGCACKVLESIITGDLIVDLGAGGWADDQCGYCDQVMGEYTLARISSCLWQYTLADVCSCTPISCATQSVSLQINAEASNFGNGNDQCRWEVTISLAGTAPTSECACSATANYLINPTTDCDLTSAITLTRTSQSRAPLCSTGASLPSTITLRRA